MRAMTFLLCTLLVISAQVSPANAQKARANLPQRISEIEEELALLRDVTGDAAKSAGEVEKLLASLNAKIAEAQALKEKVELLENAQKKNKEAIELLIRHEQRLRAMETELKQIAEDWKSRSVKFSGQLRIRPFFKSNYFDMNSDLVEDSGFSYEQRARLSASVDPTDYISAGFTFQDARLFGERGRATDSSTPSYVHQAWMELRPTAGLAIKAGRQEWNFGSGRIIGKADWSNAGRSFDGFDLSYRQKDVGSADVLFSVIEEGESAGKDNWLFGGLYLQGEFWAPSLFDAYLLFSRDPLGAGFHNNITLFGARAHGKLAANEAIFYDIEASYETGTVTEGAADDQVRKENDHLAALYHLGLGYAFDMPIKPAFSFFVDWASSDANRNAAAADNTESSAWLPLFPTRHAMLGKMDLFEQTNIRDIGVELATAPASKLTATAQLHFMSLVSGWDRIPAPGASVVTNPTTESGDYLGTEIDLESFYAVDDKLTLGAGYSVFLPGQAVKDQIKVIVEKLEKDNAGNTTLQRYLYSGGDPAHYLWLQADLRF